MLGNLFFKTSFLVLVTFTSSVVFAAEDTIKPVDFHYDRGLQVDVPSVDSSLSINALIQPKYSFTDHSAFPDDHDFDLRRLRLILGGNLLSDMFSFETSYGFIDDRDSSRNKADNLRDAWIQFNALDELKVRAGRFKVPYSRQYIIPSRNLSFLERAVATEQFALGRQSGAMLLGSRGGFEYAVAGTAGDDSGDSLNRSGIDVDGVVAGSFSFSGNNYKRDTESDIEADDDFSYTVGSSISYEDAEGIDGEIDIIQASGDIGARIAGFSFQAEYFYRRFNITGDGGSQDNAFYAQITQFIVPQLWEIGSRYSLVFPDDRYDNIQTSLVVTRYFNEYNFKVQMGATFENIDVEGADDFEIQRYELMATAYL